MDNVGIGEYTSPSEKITIRLPTNFLRILDYLVAVDYFSSRSEAIRTAIRDMIFEKVPEIKEKMDRIKEVQDLIAELEILQKDMRK